jgi:hypothetical protein
MPSGIPADSIIVTGVESLHIIICEFEVKHGSIFLDPFVGNRFGKGNKTLFG